MSCGVLGGGGSSRRGSSSSSSAHLLHLDLVLAEHALQALAGVEQHAALLVQEEQQGGAAVVHIRGQHLFALRVAGRERAGKWVGRQAGQRSGGKRGCAVPCTLARPQDQALVGVVAAACSCVQAPCVHAKRARASPLGVRATPCKHAEPPRSMAGLMRVQALLLLPLLQP